MKIALLLASILAATGQKSGTQTISTPINPNLIGPVTATGSTTARSLAARFADVVNVKDFGAKGDGVTDDTAAIQVAIDAAKTGNVRTVRFGPGKFLVSAVTVNAYNPGLIDPRKLVIDGGGGALVGKTSGTFDAVFTVYDSTHVTVKDLAVSAQRNGGYKSAIRVWSDGTYSCNHLQFINVDGIDAQLAWVFGDDAYPDAQVSEITVFGGHVTHSLAGVLAIGTQTLVRFNGTILTTSLDGGALPAGWTATPASILARGAFVGFSGGEIWTDVWSGVGAYVQPITSALYSNPWGSIDIGAGTQIEINSARLALASNPSGVTNPGGARMQGGLLRVAGYGYHGTDTAAFVETSADFVGTVDLRGGRFYGVTQTHGTVLAGSANTVVELDRGTFGTGFLPPPAGVSGGTVRLASRSAQSFPAYGTTVSIDPSLDADVFYVVASNGAAFTVSNPAAGYAGQEITIQFVNNTAGALGNVTFGSAYKLAGVTAQVWSLADGTALSKPAAGKNRAITFRYDGTANWFEVSRTPADVPAF